jgi:hypothetical protein
MSVRRNIPTGCELASVALLADGTVGAKSDTKLLKRHVVGFVLEAAGNIKVRCKDGTTPTLTGWATGVEHGMYITQLYSTGTTVADTAIQLLYSEQ